MAPSLKTTLDKINRTLENNVRIANKVIEENVRNVSKAAKKVPWLHVVIGVVAVGIILYCIWKLLKPKGRKEGYVEADGWTKYDNKDLLNMGDYEQKMGTTVEEAKAKCKTDARCEAFAFDTAKTAFFKENISGKTCSDNNNGTTLYVKQGTTITCQANSASSATNPASGSASQPTYNNILNGEMDAATWNARVQEYVGQSQAAKKYTVQGDAPLTNITIKQGLASFPGAFTLGGCYGQAGENSVNDVSRLVWQRTSGLDVSGQPLGTCFRCPKNAAFTDCVEKTDGGKYTVVQFVRPDPSFIQQVLNPEKPGPVTASEAGMAAGTVGTTPTGSNEEFDINSYSFYLQNVSIPDVYWIDRDWEFKAKAGENPTVWSTDGGDKLINVSGAARAYVNTNGNYVTMKNSGHNESDTKFKFVKVDGTTDKYYIMCTGFSSISAIAGGTWEKDGWKRAGMADLVKENDQFKWKVVKFNKLGGSPVAHHELNDKAWGGDWGGGLS